MENDKKILSLIGLCMRAGQLKSGEFSTENAVRDKKAKLVLVAGDASDNTVKLFTDKCRSYGVECRRFSDKASLGRALGKELRASCAILDEGFAGKIKELIDKQEVE